MGNTHGQENVLPHSSLGGLLQASVIWSIILLQTKTKINGDLYPCILEVCKRIFIPSEEDEDMT